LMGQRQDLAPYPRIPSKLGVFWCDSWRLFGLLCRIHSVSTRSQTSARGGSVIKSIHEKFGLIDSEMETSEDIPEEDRVLVTTLYSAKGLEAEFVFIMWLNDKFFPAPHRDIKEELRVLYVGMTRAKQNVTFMFDERYDKSKRARVQSISPFLQKIIHHINITRLKKTDFEHILTEFY